MGLGYGLTPRIAVEGDLSFAPGGEQGVITQFDTSVWSLSANLLYHFVAGDRDFTPYVVGGLGILSGNADIEEGIVSIGFEPAGLVVEVAQVVVHEGDGYLAVGASHNLHISSLSKTVQIPFFGRLTVRLCDDG